jgi:hypothetical protein
MLRGDGGDKEVAFRRDQALRFQRKNAMSDKKKVSEKTKDLH